MQGEGDCATVASMTTDAVELTDAEKISVAMKLLRARVKDNARTPDQCRKAQAASVAARLKNKPADSGKNSATKVRRKSLMSLASVQA